MRKALMAVLMAATIATPLAAQDSGQNRSRREGFVRSVQGATQNRTPRQQQPRVERQQQRTERREVRQENRTERREVRQENRAERQANRPARVAVQPPAATWPGSQQRANEAVNRGLRQEARNERRDDRRDARIERRDDQRDNRIERRDDRRDNRFERRDDRRDARNDWRNDRRDNRQAWNRNWRSDNRYDWQRYRYANRNLFRRGSYYAPYRDYRYSRFSIGLYLGSAFYSNRYWINDPWQYRLPPAYSGTQWVRYYDDVMLVDIYTGEVLDVIYDFFW